MLRSVTTSIVDIANVTTGYAPMCSGHLVDVSGDIQTVFQLLGLSWNDQETGLVYVKLDAAPGAGKTVAIALYVTDRNGDSPVEVASGSISDSDTSVIFDLDPYPSGVSYDYCAWKITASASHGASVARISIALNRKTFMRTVGPNFSAQQDFQGFQGNGEGGYPFNDGKWQMFGASGYCNLDVAIPATQSGTFYVFLNGSSTPIITLSMAVGSGGTAYSFSPSFGDIVEAQIVPDVSAFRALLSSDFIPNTVGEYPAMGGFTPLSFASNPTQYVSPFSDYASGTSESDYQIVIPCGCVVDRLLIRQSSVPGTMKSVTYTLRKNGLDTGLTATVEGAFSFQGYDLGNSVTFAPGDLASVSVVGTGGPSKPSWVAIGFRIVALTGGGSIPSDIAIQAPAGGSITGNIYTVAPAATSTFWGISGDVDVQGKPTTTIVGDIDIAPIPNWPILCDIHIVRDLNGGAGWLGPWGTGDKQTQIAPAYVSPNSDPDRFTWATGDTGITLDGAGPGILGWSDRSGWGRDFSATSGNGPTKVDSATPNGDPILSWPVYPGSKFLTQSAALGLTQPFSLILAVKILAWHDNGYLVSGIGAPFSIIVQHTTSPRVAAYSGSYLDNNDLLIDGNFHILTVRFNGASTGIQVDNQTEVTGNPGTRNMNSLYLGNYSPSPAFGTEHYLAGIIATKTVTASMIANHKAWLADYVGISI